MLLVIISIWLKYESLGEIKWLKIVKVLVLGAGYAGLQTVTKLQKAISTEEAEITLINKMNITMKRHGYMKHQQVH